MWPLRLPDSGGGQSCLFGTDPRQVLGCRAEGGVTVIDEHGAGLTAGQGLTDSQPHSPCWGSSDPSHQIALPNQSTPALTNRFSGCIDHGQGVGPVGGIVFHSQFPGKTTENREERRGGEGRGACRSGFYKSSSGNLKCSKCPPHSFNHQEGSIHCACEKNYFRSEGDPASMACTRPPSAPRNVISVINETSVILDWNWPADTGGRRDVTFNVVCKRCSPGRQCEPCRGAVRFLPRPTGLSNTTVTVTDLLAHTNYTFEIEALNGVSALASTHRQFAAVTITTNQAAPSPVTIIRKDRTSRNSISLSWLEPERPNGIILDYEVKYYEKQEQETSYTILRSKGTNVTLTGLKPDTTYLLQIRARTAAGYGASSRKFEFETSPDSFSISSENSQVVLIAISSAVAIILLTIVVYILVGRFCGYSKSKHPDEKRLHFGNVRLPGIRTYVDPHTYEDPSQAVHEFAKELDASCIAIDKVVGAGKPVMIVTEYMENGSLDSFLRVIKAVDEGYRLPPPMDCPAALYQLMLDCWQKDRNNRPKFEQIVSILDKLIRNPSSLKIIANTASR
ncbi:hypothetical protein JZ751_027816 [Albula glossodonta]|uniref:Fibronectin type-III domain-containing protein n=1 Tax=Albula glossodonta TaxID=121402 RepID=A0A8T2P797_9TELE|nr:hypothetical protein JZ751_027816 [Albula glossodonta]